VAIATAMTGTRAAVTANLWTVQELTGSTLAVGVLSLLEALTVLGFAPIAGTLVDRLHRRRMLQASQGLVIGSSLIMAGLSFSELVSPIAIYILGTAIFAAATLESPARQSLVPSIVPRERLVDAYSLLVSALFVAWLLGPAIAGILIAVWGTGHVYLFTAACCGFLFATVLFIPFQQNPFVQTQRLWKSMSEGFAYLFQRPLLWQLIALDLGGTLFAAYRVLLPALAQNVFFVGPAGYGFLAAAPAIGAIIGAGTVYRLRTFSHMGRLAIGAAAGYSIAVMLLGHSPLFLVAVAGAAAIGYFASIGGTIRHATILAETPDRLRGRVASAYQIFTRGGTSIGEAQLGAVASVVGPVLALTAGGAIALTATALVAIRGKAVREYENTSREAPELLSPLADSPPSG
jgi:MFS family permease